MCPKRQFSIIFTNTPIPLFNQLSPHQVLPFPPVDDVTVERPLVAFLEIKIKKETNNKRGSVDGLVYSTGWLTSSSQVLVKTARLSPYIYIYIYIELAYFD